MTDGPSGNPANIRLDTALPIWLDVPGGAAGPGREPRYLLLEDPETGDVLLPLIYMKKVLDANYSRKLASLKNRLVIAPARSPLARHEGLLYWQWAFESPHAVKIIVRREMGDVTPQGHLRLVLLPIVYNAMAQRPDLRASPLFRALHAAVRRSSYAPLVHQLTAEQLAAAEAGEVPAGEGGAAAPDGAPTPDGAPAVDGAAARAGAPALDLAAAPNLAPAPAAEGAPAADALAAAPAADALAPAADSPAAAPAAEALAAAPAAPPASAAPPLFAGPRELGATAVKYMFMFRDQGEVEANKKLRTTGTPHVDLGAVGAALAGPPGAEAHGFPGRYGDEDDGYGGVGPAAFAAAADADAAALGLPPMPALPQHMLGIPTMPMMRSTPVEDGHHLEARVRELAGEVRLLKSNLVQLYNAVTQLVTAAPGGPPPGYGGGLQAPAAPARAPPPQAYMFPPPPPPPEQLAPPPPPGDLAALLASGVLPPHLLQAALQAVLAGAGHAPAAQRPDLHSALAAALAGAPLDDEALRSLLAQIGGRRSPPPGEGGFSQRGAGSDGTLVGGFGAYAGGDLEAPRASAPHQSSSVPAVGPGSAANGP